MSELSIDGKFKSKWLDMIDKQYRLNVFTNGEKWFLGYTDKGKRIHWDLAIIDELMELVNSLPWKHWKSINKPIDKENLKVEVLDLMHFYMSLIINIIGDEIGLSYNNIERNIENIKKEIEDFHLYPTKDDLCYIVEPSLFPMDDETFCNNIYYYVKRCIFPVTYSFELTRNSLLDFFQLVKLVQEYTNFHFEEIHGLYIAKYSLNKLRQLRGYKDGTYLKMWKDPRDESIYVEDNVAMMYFYNLNKNNINETDFLNTLLSYYDPKSVVVL